MSRRVEVSLVVDLLLPLTDSLQPSALPISPNPLPQTEPPPPRQNPMPKVRSSLSSGDNQLRNIALVDDTLVDEPAPVPKRKGRPPNSKSKPPHADDHGTYFFTALLSVTLPTVLRCHHTTIAAEAKARYKSERTSIRQKATTED